MNWYLAKIVYQIICGNGSHTPQFDEQLRLVSAADEEEAFNKALQIGRNEADSFCNTKNELINWKFINIAELHMMGDLIDGAELYSRIQEVDDGDTYIEVVHRKARFIREQTTHQSLHLI
jgi:hypothetical protein